MKPVGMNDDPFGSMSRSRLGTTRRGFLRIAVGGAGVTLLAACAPPPSAVQPTTAPAPAATTAPGAQPTAAAAAKPAASTAPAPAATPPLAAAPTQAPTAAAAAKPGGVLRVGGETPFDSLDPHTVRIGWQIHVMANVYSGLVRPGTDLLPKPDLATEWKYTDPKTLQLTLRQGAKFHNGREVVADDVKYSVQRVQDPKTAAGYASLVDSVESIDTPDKYTVVMHLKNPDAALINNLMMPSMAIVAKEVVEQNGGSLKTAMVGSGPFKFQEHVPNQRLVLVKNPDYYIKGQPLLDGLTIVPLPDETARTNALRAGDIDYIEPAAPKDVPALKNDKSMIVSGGPNLGFVGISVNTTHKPFDDVRVRQAMAYTISRDEIAQKAFDGQAQGLWGPALIPPFWAGNTDKYYSIDLTRAKQLLSDAGLPNGFNATITTSTTTSYHAAFAAVVQSELKKIGINIDIKVLDGAVANQNWIKGDFDLYPIRWWGSDFIDPDGAFRPTFSCKGSYNNSRGCDPSFDDYIVKGLETTALEDRKAVYRDAMKELATNQPWVFLVNFDRYQAMKSFVQNYTAYPNGSQWAFREVWLNK